MIFAWFDAVVRSDQAFVRLAVAEGPDFVGGYIASRRADQTYQLLHRWAAADDPRTDVFDDLDAADLRHVIAMLEEHMRRAPTYIQITDVETALQLARLAARTGHFMPLRASDPDPA